jgi:hypothetical protein
MNLRKHVEGIDKEDSGMGEDMTIELELVERESESRVSVRH